MLQTAEPLQRMAPGRWTVIVSGKATQHRLEGAFLQ